MWRGKVQHFMTLHPILCFPDGHFLFDRLIKECGLVHVKLLWVDFQFLFDLTMSLSVPERNNCQLQPHRSIHIKAYPGSSAFSHWLPYFRPQLVNGLNWMETFLLVCAGGKLIHHKAFGWSGRNTGRLLLSYAADAYNLLPKGNVQDTVGSILSEDK